MYNFSNNGSETKNSGIKTSKLAREHVSTQGTLAREHVTMQGTLTREHVSTQGVWARGHVSTQNTLAREQLSTQELLACEHIGTQGMLAREHETTQDTLAREHIFSTQGTQFSRLVKKDFPLLYIPIFRNLQSRSVKVRNSVPLETFRNSNENELIMFNVFSKNKKKIFLKQLDSCPSPQVA